MAMEITNNYNAYTTQYLTESNNQSNTINKKSDNRLKSAQNVQNTSQSSANTQTESLESYMRKLEKLAPCADFRIGSTFACDRYGKTLTINPAILKKMQEDPAVEKEMKELIGGVQTADRLLESLYRGTGWKVVYRHDYIDENGKFSSCAYVVNEGGYKMSEKLREEQQKNFEKRMQKAKARAAEKKKELQEILEEKRTAQKEKRSPADQAKELLEQKTAASVDGRIYLNHREFQNILKAAETAPKAIQMDRAGTEEQAAAVTLSKEGMELWQRQQLEVRQDSTYH